MYRRGSTSDYVAYACDRRTGRVSRLGVFSASQGEHVYAFRLKGAVVAYDWVSCIYSYCDARVRVLHLRLRWAQISAAQETREPFAGVTGLELSDTGAVVWIRDLPGAPEIRKLDAGGEAVLDSGPDVDKDSLAVGGSNAYWLKGGQPRTALLR